MSPAPTLHFFCGKAGAGKSTVASRLAQDHGAILISEDICMLRKRFEKSLALRACNGALVRATK